jgi:hypothetical protein
VKAWWYWIRAPSDPKWPRWRFVFAPPWSRAVRRGRAYQRVLDRRAVELRAEIEEQLKRAPTGASERAAEEGP